MKPILLALPLLVAFGCTRDAQPGVQEVDVDTAASWLDGKSAKAVDANTEDFRAQNGVVPGAVLLSNYLDWEPPAVLGPDKTQKLIFYCASRT